MNIDDDRESTVTTDGPKWPWWEPYVYTAGVFAAVIVLLMGFGVVARLPFAEHIVFGLMTIAGLVEAVRKSASAPSLAGNISFVVFFGLAGFAYFSMGQRFLGFGYVLLTVIWLYLSANAAVTRHKLAKESSARLGRAVETMRRVVQGSE